MCFRQRYENNLINTTIPYDNALYSNNIQTVVLNSDFSLVEQGYKIIITVR